MKTNKEIIKRALGIALFETERSSKEIASYKSITAITKQRLIDKNDKEVLEYARVLEELEEDDNNN